MSNYNITTNFGDKDSLPSGNAQKVVKGSEFTTEFTNIKTAVNSKADTAGDTFTGAVNFSADVAFDTDTLFVDVSANRVGIGTTSPSAPLDVRGSSIELTGSNPELVLKDTDSAESQCVITNHDGTIDIKADVNSERNNSRIRFHTDGTQHMELKGGNLGIGVTSPASKLHVRGSDSGATGVADGTLIVEQGSAPSIQILSANTQTQSIKFGDPQDGDVGKINYSHTDNHMALFTDGTEAMRIDSNGNVLLDTDAVSLLNTDSQGGKGRIGVGTATPSYHLEVAQSTDAYIGFKTPNSKSNYIFFHNSDANTTSGKIEYSHPTDSLSFKVNGSSQSALTLSNDNTVYAYNRISINEDDPSNIEGKLHINVDGSISALSIDNTKSGGSGNEVLLLNYQRNGATTSTLSAQNDGSISYLIGTSGFGYQGTALSPMSYSPVSSFGTDNGGSNLGTGTSRWGYIYLTNSPNVSSDKRLKENIMDADDAGTTIDNIQIRKFDWIDSGEHQSYGVVAQELAEVFPEAVSGEENEEDIMGVSYEKLIPMLVKEVQSLRSRVAELENV